MAFAYPQFDFKNFVFKRRLAEFVARKLSPDQEITLEAIYQIFSKVFRLPREKIDDLIEIELNLERQMSEPIGLMRDYVKNISSSGIPYVFLSDVYLSQSFVADLLRRADIPFQPEQLWISSEKKKTKASGDLFACLFTQKKMSPKDILHIGDNYEIDFSQSQKQGLRAFDFSISRPDPFESRLYRRTSGGLVGELLAGVARNMRLKSQSISPKSIYYELGRTLVGPLTLLFSIWLMKRFEKTKLQKVFFLARDGDLPFQFMEHLKEKLNLRWQNCYLEVSRQALRLPGILTLQMKDLDWIFDFVSELTLKMVLRRLNIAPQSSEAMGLLARASIESLESPLSSHQIAKLKKLLMETEWRRLIETNASCARALLLQYLDSQKFLNQEAVGLVDLGWKGSLRGSLSSVLAIAERNVELRDFYFGLLVPERSEDPKHIREAFLFSRDLGSTYFGLGARTIPLMEILLSSDSFSTMGYEQLGQSIEPVFDENEDERAQFVLIQDLHRGALDFLKEFRLEELKILKDCSDDFLRTSVASLLAGFANSPSHEEAEAFGKIYYRGDQGQAGSKEFARPLSYLELMRFFYQPKIFYAKMGTYWPEGSVERVAGLQRWISKFSTRAIYLKLIHLIVDKWGIVPPR